jgi:hypothetical protein
MLSLAMKAMNDVLGGKFELYFPGNKGELILIRDA